jgi:hypothetical protein
MSPATDSGWRFNDLLDGFRAEANPGCMRARSMVTIAAALAAVVTLARSAEAEACDLARSRFAPPPALIEGRVIPPRLESGRWQPAAIILQVAPGAGSYAVERMAGDAPFALEPVWRSVHRATADGVVAIPLDQSRLVPSFGVAVRVREVGDGRGSDLVWLDYQAPELAPHGAGGDAPQRGLFVGFAIVLGLLAAGFRRARDAETRIRLAAVAALGGAVVLLATAGVPWFHSATAHLDCLLGSESVCAPPPLAALDDRSAAMALFELERWRAGGAAIRMGQLMVFALLLPALVWLLVEPRTRPAQATCLVGASVAGFTFLAIACFEATMPSWLVAEPYAAFDLGLLGAAAIVVAAIAIVRQTFAMHDGAAPPPRATARR